MKLAGFVPVSLCDWPGKVAAVVFTQGCNFRCPWCHNAHLIPRRSPAAIDHREALSRIARCRHLLGGVAVSGGEPTLQPGLPDFLREIKALGLPRKLDTNGSHPEVLRRLLDQGLLDFVALDIKAPWSRYGELIGIPQWDAAPVRQSVELLVAAGIPCQLRTTRVPKLLDESDCDAIIQQLPQGHAHCWQTYRHPL